jgi:hypothetical protein
MVPLEATEKIPSVTPPGIDPEIPCLKNALNFLPASIYKMYF